mmetsp:Transcript_8498/g.19024  ORF Transcript_8498/g.19024 Transcript_8498/m.19024 type:complete len:94 (-) Transcript_8498:66-347(-)|eukprot:CAMPEP_0172301860 /NCGR_PEP_ID=MMETSP1058-20130122/3678_1 /TAXON_ID=83371 /ORGANISM="Detonula confervacea, Strain CCMP 353" /LENGTH=93 /DNA_ID=CAMNT_0013012151 /DNA_START=101 /DNA_END=382 /DNA_ORIENTATION=+
MISRVEWIQRVVGLKGGQFRQTGMTGGNIIFGTILGVLSGKYIFEEPLQHYWAEKHAEEAAAAANNAGLPSSASSGISNGTTTPATTNNSGKS